MRRALLAEDAHVPVYSTRTNGIHFWIIFELRCHLVRKPEQPDVLVVVCSLKAIVRVLLRALLGCAAAVALGSALN